MKHFIRMFNFNRFDVTGFYPYTSGILCPVLEQNNNYKTEEHDFLQMIGNEAKEQAEAKGCVWDNKVVVEITFNHTKSTIVPAKIYVGWYDGRYSLGFGVWQDEYLKDRNKHFEVK